MIFLCSASMIVNLNLKKVDNRGKPIIINLRKKRADPLQDKCYLYKTGGGTEVL